MERRTLSPEDMKKLEALVAGSPLLDNAFRLMVDGHVLFENERYSSVVALSVLCLEEIGKHLLKLWSAADPAFQYDKRQLHKMKQVAVAALFMSDGVRREYLKKGVDFSNLRDGKNMKMLIEAMKTGIGKEDGFAGNAGSGVLQIVKHSGLYYDEDLAVKGIEPAKIKGEDADGMMRTCSRAFMVLTDDKAVGIAATFFTVMQKNKAEGKGSGSA